MHSKEFTKANDIPVERDPDGSMSLAIARDWIYSDKSDLQSEAVKLLERLRKEFPQEPAMLPLLILALMETKRLDEADMLLLAGSRKIGAESRVGAEEETLCRAGRMFRERAEAAIQRSANDSSTTQQALGLFRAACRYYERAYRVRDGHYPLINLAELYLIKASYELAAQRDGYLRTSRELAMSLLNSRSTWPIDFDDDDVWHAATEAHAYILIGRWDNAVVQLHLAKSSPNWKPFHASSISKGLRRTINALERLKIPVDERLQDPEALLRSTEGATTTVTSNRTTLGATSMLSRRKLSAPKPVEKPPKSESETTKDKVQRKVPKTKAGKRKR